MEKVFIYDTTLRDGTQRQGISLSISDKLKIAKILDKMGVDYIEGGWPGSNPKDQEFFRKVKELNLKNSKVAAFGSTRRAKLTVEEDTNIRALIESETPTVTIVGKSWDLHVTEVLSTTLDENLKMIEESVSFLKKHNREVIYDAEHFFDGFKANDQYALKTINAALQGGADWVILCDTNGGSLPEEVQAITKKVISLTSGTAARVGIHTHNDCELAVANSYSAVIAGARQIQGTINGYGERCGNANLTSLVPLLQLKTGFTCIPQESIQKLVEISRTVAEIANLAPDEFQPFVGKNAFAHKGGIHVAAVEKISYSYEHIPPESVGNSRNIVVSELSGQGNIRMASAALQIDLSGKEKDVLAEIKNLEQKGYQFENADGSFELVLRKFQPNFKNYFETEEIKVSIARDQSGDYKCTAVIKIKINNSIEHVVAEGDGPVKALDEALRKALAPHYPQINNMNLIDFKVRIINPDSATDATVRVHIEAMSHYEKNQSEHDFETKEKIPEIWTTVGCSKNIIEASYIALSDSFEVFLQRGTIN